MAEAAACTKVFNISTIYPVFQLENHGKVAPSAGFDEFVGLRIAFNVENIERILAMTADDHMAGLPQGLRANAVFCISRTPL